MKNSNVLRSKNTVLDVKDHQVGNFLLEFSVSIENNLQYFEIETYLELCNDFLAKEIGAEDFCCAFMGTYISVTKKLDKMETEKLIELLNLLKLDNSELGNLLINTYGIYTSFSQDPEVDNCITTEE